MKCIICDKRVEELHHFSDDPAQNCWSAGLVEWVTAGYGSAFDMSRFLICLCDRCLLNVKDTGESDV